MAIPKRGSRIIVIDGITYRWHVRKKASYSKHLSFWTNGSVGVTIAVEHAETPGSVLVAHMPPQQHPISGTLPVVSVVPSQVAESIARALATGWEAKKPGGPFRLRMAELTRP